MATIITSLAILVDETTSTNAEVQVDWDDVSLVLLRVRVINPTSKAVLITATKQSNGRSFSRTFAAGQTTAVDLPTSAGQRILVTVNGNHGARPDGVDYDILWA